MEQILYVFCNDVATAKIQYDNNDDTFHLEYLSDWVKTGFELSPHLAFSQPIPSSSVKKFLANLLPEGSGLEELSLYFQVSKSNVFGMITKLAAETAGALVFSSNDTLIPQTLFRPITTNELTQRIREREIKSIVIWDGKPRLSLAGVQDKLPIIVRDGSYGIGEGDLASTHILKFDAKKGHHTVLNEFLCMNLAKKAGLDAAHVEIRRFENEPVLFVERFDRKVISLDKTQRIHIIDGCQMLNLFPFEKYERSHGSGRDVAHYREGASMKKTFNLTSLCSSPAADTLKMIRWSVYNLFISNFDAHGKNISFYVRKGKIEISPFYDLVNVSMYPNFSQELAMAVGDVFESRAIKAYDLAQLCDECSINPRLLVKEFGQIGKKLTHALNTIDVTHIAINKEELFFIETLVDNIKQNIENFTFIAQDILSAYNTNFKE
ncbi:MAG: HipA domain-containing protein [Sulfuricurvum sp.]